MATRRHSFNNNLFPLISGAVSKPKGPAWFGSWCGLHSCLEGIFVDSGFMVGTELCVSGYGVSVCVCVCMLETDIRCLLFCPGGIFVYTCTHMFLGMCVCICMHVRD